MPLDLRSLLNAEQFEAATTIDGPLLVLAGAGSGKTRVLVHRIAHIVEEKKAWPRQIFAVTFTNKAAGEMRARLAKMLPQGADEAWIGTFHSMAGRMLRREGHRLGYDPSFTIYDTDDSKRVIKRVMEDLGLDTEGHGVSVAGVMNEIDRAKNQGLSPKQFLDREPGFFTPSLSATRRVYPRYQDLLRRSNAMDFGDMILLAVELLEHHPEARQKIAGRFKYVMVDEFQDTNRVQYDLLKALVKDHKNLMVVGDDDQSIYRWRGAEVANILEFPKTFPEAKVVKLEQNYRSTGNILSAANAIIRRNRKRHPKTLKTDAPPGVKIGVALLNHGDEEAYLVAQTIAARLREGQSAADYAILYRQNAQSRSFEEALRRARVPFTIIGGTGFYERREVKDILAYLRLIANPSSMEDFERVVNVPPRKIGDTTVNKLRELGEKHQLSGVDILSLPKTELESAKLTGKTYEKLREFAALIATLGQLSETEPASEIARQVVEKVDYLGYLDASDPATADDRRENVKELVSSIAEHEISLGAKAIDDLDEDGLGIAGARTPLAAFLDQASLVTTNDVESQKDTVSLLTLHAAKGLEFPVVFLVGMEESTFPSKRAIEGDEDDLEEERRLCYVGVTRAMRELNMLAARYRRIYGSEEVRAPSRFLGELPDSIVTTFGKRSDLFEQRTDRRVVYDDVPEDRDAYVPPAPRARMKPPEPVPGEINVGSRVIHNLFGTGVVEEVSGSGPKAHLTIRFPTEGTKRVVARFVRLVEE